MGMSLAEYLDWLDERHDLLWPQPPRVQPIKATPFLKPLTGIRLVTWNIYGTLLRIDTGRLHHLHPQPLRMQIALEKTIEEFRMWYSMSRKPGQPWEYLLQQYKKLVEDASLQGTQQKGDRPFIDSTRIWGKLIQRLIRNEYQFDHDLYGDEQDLALKVAYFFHANLQGVAASEGIVNTLMRLMSAGVRQGLLGDAQAFTLDQLLRAFRKQHTLQVIGEVLTPECFALSHQMRLGSASPSMYRRAAKRFSKIGIPPAAVLHITNDLQENLKLAKSAGFRTALLVADSHCTSVDNEALRNKQTQPDRLLTCVSQVCEILGI